MHLLVGLGNPGAEYAMTRHNVGFMAVEALRNAYGLPGWAGKFKGAFCKGKLGAADVALLMPQTYMNLSGQSVQPALAFYKLKPADVWVIHDDIDLPLGEVRAKKGGGDAGHNGLKSITALLGTADYNRLRLGVGRPAHKGQVSGHVLGAFSGEEFDALAPVLEWLVDNAEALLKDPQKALQSKPKAAVA